MSDEPLFAGPIHGIRAWEIDSDEDLLCGVGVGSAQSWEGGGRYTRAVCVRHRHPAPRPECSCGLYALHPYQSLLGWHLPGLGRRAIGLVEAIGRVEVHPRGFRAERARPRVLFVPPPHLGAPEQLEALARLAGRYEVQTVELPDPEFVGEWARTNGFGLGPYAVEQSLLQGIAIRLARTSRVSRDGARLTVGVWPELDLAESRGENPWRTRWRKGVIHFPGINVCRVSPEAADPRALLDHPAFAPGRRLRLIQVAGVGGRERLEVWHEHGELRLGALSRSASVRIVARIRAGRVGEVRSLTHTIGLRGADRERCWLTILITPSLPIEVEPAEAAPPTLPGWDWDRCKPRAEP
jgi:hypothetical protein